MNTIGLKFIEKTKYKYLQESDQSKGYVQPQIEMKVDKSHIIHDLPSPRNIKLKDINLLDLITNRRSVRKYTNEQITLEELSYLLWNTQGVKEILPVPITLRTVPSAGARHCLESFLLINNVMGLKPGLYRYWSTEHKLIEISLDEDLCDKVTKACLNQNFIKQSAITFIWVADVYRMSFRYGERGYRYMHLDAGHVCQNLYLSAESIDCGVCAIAAYDDDEINSLININGEDQFVIYVATLGKK